MSNTIQFNNNYPNITESENLYQRALGLIPSVTQTLAKGPEQHVKGVAPVYLQKGQGSHVWDVDGNEYIDFNMAVGPISLGYAYSAVDEAIKTQLKEGITFSLMHPLEVEVAELIKSVIPNAESVRYSKTGADITSAAIRVARAFTGKDKVLCCGYHGWHDWYISVTDRNKGIPNSNNDLTYTFNYNDINSLKESLDENIAAVILEPVVFQEPKNDFLTAVTQLCKEHNIVLIFDEMWTGFRMALGGAQEYFGITPDLACYSKAIANGMPLSVITGKKEIMKLLDSEVFFYTTFGGEALSLAAAKATIIEMQKYDVQSYLNKYGKILKEGYNNIASELGIEYTKCNGYNWRSIVVFDESAGNPLVLKSFVQQEMLKRGILWGGFHNMSFSHNDSEVNYTLEAYREVLSLLDKAVTKGKIDLKGEPVKPVFRKTSNFNTKPKMKMVSNK